MYRSIEIELKTGRKEKHKDYLHKVNITPLSPKNDVMQSDNFGNRNISKSDNVNEHEISFSKTDNNYWSYLILSLQLET